MASTFTLALNNKTGTLTSPAVDVPAGATNVVIDFDGSTLLDPAISIDTKIEFAPDGVTWRQIGGADFQCGGKKRDGVTPLPVYPTSTDIPTDGVNRQLRGTLTIIGGTISDIPTDGVNRQLRGTLTIIGGTISTVLHISTSP